MKNLKSIFTALLIIVCLVLLSAFAFAAETIAPGSTTITAQAAQPTVMQWLTANLATVFLVLLGISESLSLLPWFKGNGILDMIIKALRTLAGKPSTP